ncbi:hypothetical protein [Embleya sp. NPDC050493]|uniref:hypothetical protein n=1 Tax=Embleya sp. NPDC050493 TaxID=3363989 RepID=UPI003796F9EA
MTIRLTDAEIDYLAFRFDVMSLGAWDRSAVEGAIDGLGWTSHSEERHGSTFAGPLPGGWSHAYRGHVLGSPQEGCFTSLECDLACTEDVAVLEAVFTAARKAVEARRGPAPIRRGPGPVLRWRREDTLMEVEWSGRRVLLRLLAARVVEKHEYELAGRNERDQCVAELGVWQAYILRHPDMKGAFAPRGRRPETWEELGRWLSETLAALLTDLGRLDEQLDLVIRPADDDQRFVQLSCDAGELHLDAGSGRFEPAGETPPGRLPGAGVGRRYEIRIPNPRPDDAEPAARALLHALRAQNVNLEDLGHEAWLRRSDYATNLHGLGLVEF